MISGHYSHRGISGEIKGWLLPSTISDGIMADEEGHRSRRKIYIELHRASSTASYTHDLWFLLFRGIIEQGYQLSTGDIR